MPEMPEVETVRRVLESSITGLTIRDVNIRYAPIVEDDDFISKVEGKRIVGVLRCGKFLIIKLTDGNIVSHLRMEGKYFYLPANSMDNKHIHVIYYFDNDYMLAYQDVRKFGRMCYRSDDELYSTDPLRSVGVDPVMDEDPDIDDIYNKIIKRSTPIKTTLLDQSIIAGLGNIYVDEVLFDVQINPHRPSKNITKDEVARIVGSARAIMSHAILEGGTTIRSYTSSLGVEGNYQSFLRVHTKDICPLCDGKILKDKTNGRGTYYCPRCQKL